MLDVRRLRVLRELAARGTIAATADALGYTAPAVSQQLAALEREAGVALLERNGRTRRLTPAGEELVDRTEGILRELEAAEAALEAHDHARGRRPALRRLRERPPDPAPARDRRPLAAPSRPARDHPRHGARGQPARAQARRARPGDRAGVRVLPQPGRPGDRAHRPARGPPCAWRCRRTTLWRPPSEVDMAALEHEPWIAGREGSFCHLVVIHSTRAAGYEPRLAHITNDFDVSYALVPSRRRRWPRARTGRAPPPGVVALPVKGAAEPADLRRRARGEQRPPGDRRDARSAHRALSTESSRPGKRSSSSSRRSRFTSAVPSARCSITPLSRSTRKWCVRVDLVTGRSKAPQRHSPLGGERAHDLEPDRIGERVQDAGQLERVGGRMMQSPRHEFDCTTVIERLVRWSSYFRKKGRP